MHVGPDGELKAVYRKIHMFDVEVGGQVYRESESQEGGHEIVVSETRRRRPVGHDRLLRPALPRAVPHRSPCEGARVLLIPAAFTKVTGAAHWEILIRARAIENQAFVVAADQVGPHPPDKLSFGGSMIVDPWGDVLALAPDEECFVAADLDLRAPGRDPREAPEPGQPRARTPIAGRPRSTA